jgi:hypothetical protein
MTFHVAEGIDEVLAVALEPERVSGEREAA